MAERQVGGLSMRIGLTLSQLQSDFLAAEQTVKQGIATLNRQQNLVKIRMEAETVGLDAAVDKTKILEIQERGLMQLLEMQRDKLTLATAAYRDYAASKGANDVGAKKLETAMERERLAVVRLEAELKNLAAQKVSIDTTNLQSNIARISAQIQQIRIKAEIDTSQLSGANAAFDAQKIRIAAVTQELELQRQKLIQLRTAMYESGQRNGGNNVQTLNIKSNVLQQMQEIQRLEQKLKELQNTNVNLQIRTDSLRQAEQTISESISRINAKVENIRVRAEVDTSKLSTAASEFDRAKVQVAALTRELELQKQKLAELKKAYATSVSMSGLNSVKSINLNTDIQRQIQAIDQLKAKIEELNKIQPPKTNNLLNGYLNIKGDIAGKLNTITSAFNGVASASHSADGAISKSLEIIGAIPHPVGKAVAAFASIPLVIKGIESSLISLAENVVASGDAFYVMSRGMQLSIADAAKLSTIAKVTGIEINEVNNSMRRFSMQLTKGGEKSSLMAQTLKRYGAELTDETGRMKNELELAQELGKAFRAAQEEGNGAAFRDIVGGKFWSGDFVTFLEDLADNTEAAGTVVKNKLANPAFAHQIQGEINTLNAQAGQLGGVFESALLPVVHEIVPRMTQRFGELTDVIAANKENIKFLGDVMATPVRLLNEMTDGVISLSKAIDEAQNNGTSLGNLFNFLGEYRDDLGALLNVAPGTALTAIFSPQIGATSLAIRNYREEIEAYKQAQEESANAVKAKQDEAEARRANTLALNKANLEAQQKLETALSSTEDRRTKMVQEAEDIIFGIRSSSYEKQLREHERWQNEELAKIQELQELGKNVLGQEGLFDDEEAAFYELDNAKIIQIEEEKEQRLKEIRQRITAAERTEIQNRIIAIEEEKEKWIQAGMEKAEAEKLAERQKTQAIKQLETEIAANVDSIWQTELQNRLSQIEREKQAWIQKGVDEVKATQWAEQAKADAQRQAAMTILKNQGKEYAAYLRGGIEELEAYKLKQLKKSGVNPTFLDMTPEQLQDFQRASDFADKSLLPNFMTDIDRDHYQRYKNGQPLDEPLQTVMEALPQGLNELPTAIQDATESLSEMPPAVLNVTESLSELPTVIQGITENLPAIQPQGSDPSAGNSFYESLSQLEPEIENVTLQLSEMTVAIQEASESFANIALPKDESVDNQVPQSATKEADTSSLMAKLEPEITEVVKQLSSMNTSTQKVTQDFSSMSTSVQGTAEKSKTMATSLQGTTEKFSVMNSGLQTVTVKVNTLAAALQELTNRAKEKPAEKQPVEVSTSVSINEATAWDSEHIQELADKVADKIKDAVVNAIGGDSNSY